jgi:hypothetical protein
VIRGKPDREDHLSNRDANGAIRYEEKPTESPTLKTLSVRNPA